MKSNKRFAAIAVFAAGVFGAAASRRHVLAATIALASTFFVCAANASDFTDGQKLYAGKDYRGASAKFENAMKTNPSDPNVIYYCALAHHMSNNRARARQLFAHIVANFPSSSVAPMAATALQQLGGTPSASSSATDASSGTTGGGSYPQVARSRDNCPSLPPDPDIERLPSEVRVPYTDKNGGVYLDCALNGRAIRLHLDTGAATTLVGANQLADMGIARGETRNKLRVGGVGSNDTMKAWRDTMTISIGQIYKRNCPVTIQENLQGDGLLGQDFLGYFDVSVDKGSQQVIFRKKSAKGSEIQARGTIDVPFVQGPGGHLLVTVEVNNKPCTMFFDTGADGVCFTMNQLKQMHIDPPDGPPAGTSIGVGGTVPRWVITLNKMRLGQIIREDFRVSVVDQATMPHPLLGQDFFAGYNYKVDRSKGVIHFSPLN